MAQYDPPDSHWAADFDQRLLSTLQFLRDRLFGDEAKYLESLKRIEELREEMEQLVKDARYWAERAEGASK